ncbi:MAG: DUF4091 domain-containing protein, partial [Clostridia bacterium]|nr:DUF4091 domain-containing protein [Clostridia bacterium]
MEITISTSNVKIFNKDDCINIKDGTCLKNESFSFQLYLEAEKSVSSKIKVESDIEINVYEVKKMKGDFYLDKNTDDYYVYAKDHMYPDLLCKTDTIELQAGETATLFIEIPATEKKVGVHNIKIEIADENILFPLNVLPEKLVETDLVITHWFHNDGICNYYGVKPFGEEYYEYFKKFLKAYVKMGNNMLLVPVFTPPLDTAVGGERLTTQLVEVEKKGDEYFFDFSKFDKYVATGKEYGIKYFELSHLFTQWGGKFCPQIFITENVESKMPFDWDVKSTDENYLEFLRQYLKSMVEHLKELGIYDNTYMHLTDEPHGEDIETYLKLAEFIKANNYGLKTFDAISHFDIVKNKAVTLPAVCTRSKEFELFENTKKLLYYCIDIDDNYLSNRYFHTPLQRTEIIGAQIYETGAKGFLHWGFNFYNTQYSTRPLNPYEETTAGGNFCAGDSFLVY